MNEYHNDLQTYETSDFGCACALISLGKELIRIKPGDGRRLIFVFERNDELDKLVTDHYNGKLLVSSIKYFDAQRLLKTRMYSNTIGGQHV